MHGLEDLDHDDSGTVFRDVILLALAGFVAIVLMLLPHLNPPTKVADTVLPPGNVIVELRWPDEVNADVDLWVAGPDGGPVGYSNKDGTIFNLLRDDLGFVGDVTNLNYEVSYSRGVPSGEYTVNVHLYRNPAQVYPIPVTVVASVKNKSDAPLKRVVTTEVILDHDGVEVTAFRFKLDEDGKLVHGSIHNLPKALRSRKG
jgi:hypothetical protein